MEILRGAAADLPQPRRQKKSLLESSPKYLAFWSALAGGLKRQESIALKFTDDDRKELKMKEPDRIAALNIKKRLTELGMTYTVFRYATDGGARIVRVTNEIISKKELEMGEEEAVHSARKAGKR